MAMSRAALKKRVDALCVQVGVCPQHPTEPLRCPQELAWHGTAAEAETLHALASRLDAYVTHIVPTGPLCPQCHTFRLWCDACYRAQASPVHLPDDLFTPAERATFAELRARMHWAPHGVHGSNLHIEGARGHAPTPAPMVPEPSPEPPIPTPPAVVSAVPPEPAELITDKVTDQAEADDDDEDLDISADELRQLVRQEFQRLKGAR